MHLDSGSTGGEGIASGAESVVPIEEFVHDVLGRRVRVTRDFYMRSFASARFPRHPETFRLVKATLTQPECVIHVGGSSFYFYGPVTTEETYLWIAGRRMLVVTRPRAGMPPQEQSIGDAAATDVIVEGMSIYGNCL
jgi:hypothetical protein